MRGTPPFCIPFARLLANALQKKIIKKIFYTITLSIFFMRALWSHKKK